MQAKWRKKAKICWFIFPKTYIDKFNIHKWNYKIYEHNTNNAWESYHHVLNSKFNKKLSFWKLLAVLINEENLLYIEIDNWKKGNIISKKKRWIRTFETITSPYYKKYEEEIQKINESNDLRKKEKIISMVWSFSWIPLIWLWFIINFIKCIILLI